MNRRQWIAMGMMLGVICGIVPSISAWAQDQAGGQGQGQGKGQGKGKGPKTATTHMKFKLDSNEVASGSDVTGTVLLQSGKGKKNRTPLAGETLTVTVDGVDTGTPLVTGADGTALLTLTALADGEHNVKVSYAGSETQRKASRTQGFTVGPVVEDPDEELPDEELPTEEEPPAV